MRGLCTMSSVAVTKLISILEEVGMSILKGVYTYFLFYIKSCIYLSIQYFRQLYII